MFPTPIVDQENRVPLDLAADCERAPSTFEHHLQRAIWAFVALGVGLRVARYSLDYPLWWDEAFLAVNFIRRGFIDLLRPLDYGQVCPILFLWAELVVVKIFGFSELTLRLVPLICAVASVFLFRYAAGLVVRGVPLLLAVAIFAVSFHPIRHAADVKPYASDLLVALALLTPALSWWRAPTRAGRLWILAAIVPIALALSHPAVFVAGGIALGLGPAVLRAPRRGVIVAYGAFVAALGATFVGLYAMFTQAQSSATLSAMQAQWGKAFPPLGNPAALVGWLAQVHTGSMFAYPCGGDGGASILTFALFAAGVFVLCRRGRAEIAAVCLAPFGLALVAAALKRYPYGGVAHGSPARVMQYLVPAICLLTGVGAAALLTRLQSAPTRRRALRVTLVALALIGLAPVATDAFHPYRATHARIARDFARRFWPELNAHAEPVCLRWDLGVGPWDATNLNVAVYLCNQRIYSTRRHSGDGPHWDAVSEKRPLRCVLSLIDPAHPVVASWLTNMSAHYSLNDQRVIEVEMADPGQPTRTERYIVYEFIPRRDALSRQDRMERR